jgi:uncharacterized membrane protein YdfJ with MMPL/SSD domain
MTRLKSWVVAGLAVLAMAAMIAISIVNWQSIGGVGLDVNGWIALILGVAVTLAVGIGLMALVFISNRRGYDDPADKSC